MGLVKQSDFRDSPWLHGVMRIRWPLYFGAACLPLVWHLVESALRPPPPVLVVPVATAPCASDVVLAGTVGLMSTPVPRKPSEFWKRPPCDYPEVEISGACWILPAQEDGGTVKPPCPGNLWEARGRCWKPVGRPQRPGTTMGR